MASRKKSKAANSMNPYRTRLQVEQLEDRSLLSVTVGGSIEPLVPPLMIPEVKVLTSDVLLLIPTIEKPSGLILVGGVERFIIGISDDMGSVMEDFEGEVELTISGGGTVTGLPDTIEFTAEDMGSKELELMFEDLGNYTLSAKSSTSETSVTFEVVLPLGGSALFEVPLPEPDVITVPLDVPTTAGPDPFTAPPAPPSATPTVPVDTVSPPPPPVVAPVTPTAPATVQVTLPPAVALSLTQGQSSTTAPAPTTVNFRSRTTVNVVLSPTQESTGRASSTISGSNAGATTKGDPTSQDLTSPTDSAIVEAASKGSEEYAWMLEVFDLPAKIIEQQLSSLEPPAPAVESESLPMTQSRLDAVDLVFADLSEPNAAEPESDMVTAMAMGMATVPLFIRPRKRAKERKWTLTPASHRSRWQNRDQTPYDREDLIL